MGEEALARLKPNLKKYYNKSKQKSDSVFYFNGLHGA